MDQARMQSLVAAGLARAALRIGAGYAQYRPRAATAPLGAAPIATIMGIFDPDPDLAMIGVEDRHAAFASFLGDMSGLLPGDYLVGTDDTWFVAHLEKLRPALCVRCNRTLSVLAATETPAIGSTSYGGRTSATDTVLASGWPASLLSKAHVEGESAHLPDDVKIEFSEALLPPITGVTVTHGMRLRDDFGQSYFIASSELSVTGWRLAVGLETT